jgi:hypothetical protein
MKQETITRQAKDIKRKVYRWHHNRNELQRTLIWTFVGLIIVALLFNMGVQAWNGYHGKNINAEECKAEASTILGLATSNSWWQSALIIYAPVIKMLLVAIGIAWILHGVQLRLLA